MLRVVIGLRVFCYLRNWSWSSGWHFYNRIFKVRSSKLGLVILSHISHDLVQFLRVKERTSHRIRPDLFLRVPSLLKVH